MWNNYYRLISKFLHSDAKILEVGCGKGAFLEELRDNGFSMLWGMEQSRICQNILRDKHIQIFENWEEVEGGKFDLIILHAVFEHLPAPRQMMQHIVESLSAEGKLFVTVPDASSYCKYDVAPFYYFDREHINHFNIQSLLLLGALHSFAPLSIQVIENKTIGPMKNHWDIAGIFKLNNTALTSEVRQYISACGNRKTHIPEEVFQHKNVFLWGIGAFAENLLYNGYFNNVENLHLLDVDLSKQGKIVCGRRICPPNVLLDYNDGNAAVVITSVLYCDKIKEALSSLGFKGKCYTIIQE